MREEFGHRRSPISRTKRLARGLVAAGTGCLVLALPVVTATDASAAPAKATAVHASVKAKGNLNLWIKKSLKVMHKHRIPGTYNGIYRNVMRESAGKQYAINLWDSNARAGIPSKGLLQIIPPTFKAYHVRGTSWNIYDPVANITAACNYAAHRYGSIDNVHSAY